MNISDIFHGMIASMYNSKKVKQIEFNWKWANGTGYFDHAVRGEDAPILAIGEMVKTCDNHSRQLLLIGTQLGNFIIFDRYSNAGAGVVVCNGPRVIRELIGLSSGALKLKDLELLLGDDLFIHNVGLRFEMCMKAVQLPEKCELDE